MDANIAKLEEMNFYIEAGRFLNDFDRNNNFDLKEILDFFKPNNRLFGDYEIRKKMDWNASSIGKITEMILNVKSTKMI